MTSISDDSDRLIEKARAGDPAAEAALLAGHRDRLRRLVSSRIDRRVAARIDPSDVIQEAMAEAASRLSDYLRNPPLPLVAWLSQFTLERLSKLHRYHLRTRKRSVARERRPLRADQSEPGPWSGLDPIAGDTSPSGRLIKDEARDHVRRALARLPEGDRKLLEMRHLEARSMAEIGEVFGISEGAAKVRHLRAIRRLKPYLEDSE